MKFDNKKFAAAVAIVAQFAVETSKTSVDNDVTTEIKEALDKIDFTKPVSPEAAEAAVFDMAECATALSETPWDDAALGAIELMSKSSGFMSKLLEKVKGSNQKDS